ncbi:AzlD domain-containing protein [Acinetobacter rudis]|uniref:AzlD domain-containing protein n=1 Tax=Acinetobacter rudis TaxID=632955 RepID=UPI00280C5EBA|nr:AzlD domain-containing protein [Acinetobacter rudis]MDQ8952389.1 AzlD domain-containing protein [Acinetobacter rudis]
MNTHSSILLGIFILAAGTYLIRYSGLYLANRIQFTAAQKQIMSDSACILLFALAVLSTLFSDNQWSDSSKIIGVIISLIFAWKQYSLIVVILVAVLTTALLRYIGLP